ncbi:MAG: polynucleotide adenylyltransferase PcnB [Deltaproteobacteria bacterium]|nr:polynucleotide adenylyltransferase PcnB [Deltaproteobacteria bacterium]
MNDVSLSGAGRAQFSAAELLPRVDEQARGVVTRLSQAGHEAYLVGGCVRDLILGRTPKDFDVATSAHPSEIRMLFRNSRLIGRRFRLAHVFFQGGKIVETATFRANPFDEMEDLPEDLLISQDNVFGNAEQDARRRDFTINGLFLDPVAGRVVDYVDGLPDLERRLVRTIGDPEIRLREDPVRILRAAKFAARLGFEIEERTAAAMRAHAGELARCATARLVEEIYRLVHCGAARRAFELLTGLEVLPALLPEVAALHGDAAVGLQTAALLGAYDDARARGYLGSNALPYALLLYPALVARGAENGWLAKTVKQIGDRLRSPKRDRERALQMLELCRELEAQPRQERAARALVRRTAFAESLVLYALWLHASGQSLFAVGEWKAIARSFGVAIEALPGADEAKRHAGRRPRRGGRRPAGGRPQSGKDRGRAGGQR